MDEKQIAMQEYKELSEKLESLEREVEYIAVQTNEIKKAIAFLEDVCNNEITEDSEILFPVASGIFIRTKKAAVKETLINIGGNIILKKPASETLEILRKRLSEFKEYEKNLSYVSNDLINKLNEFRGKL